MYDALIKDLTEQQAEIARTVFATPVDPGTYREMRGRWLGLGDALASIQRLQDADDDR